MIDYLLQMNLEDLQNLARHFRLFGFDGLSKRELVDFLITNIPYKTLQKYIEYRIVEDEQLGKRIENELFQYEMEEQFSNMYVRPNLEKQFSNMRVSQNVSQRPTLYVDPGVLNSLLSDMKIKDSIANNKIIKFRKRGGQLKRLQS